MNPSRALTIARRVLRGLRHDRRTVAFLVLLPIFMIAIFGYTFGGEVKGVKVYVVDLDQGEGSMTLADDIVGRLRGDSRLSVAQVLTGDDGLQDPVAYAREKVAAGEAWGAIVFDENFTRTTLARLQVPTGYPPPAGKVGLLVDGTDINIMRTIQSSLQEAVSAVLVQDTGFVPPVMIEQEMVYGEGLDFIDTFAPGVICLAVMMVTFMLSIISFIHERTTGTLDRLLSTPLRESEVVVGYALAYGLVGLVQSTVVITTAVLLFDVQILGSVLLVLLMVLILGVGMQGLGFLLSANARTEFQAIQFIPIILFPSILLAGVFWPLLAVPPVLQPISYLLPLTYAVDGTRSVMIRGWGLDEVGLDLLVLIMFAALMLSLSMLLLRRRR